MLLPSAVSHAVPTSEFAPLADSLRQEAERGSLRFLPNPGNWGAALTAAATRRFLESRAIPFREIQRLGPLELTRAFLLRETLLLGGGGAWSDRYPGGRQLAARASRFFRRVVVLPSSLGAPIPRTNAVLWARDRFSSQRNAPSARFCHDLGFSMVLPEAPPPTAGVGEFRRGDKLSELPEPGASLDLSSRGTEQSPLAPFIQEIARHEEIHTDRVHVAIAACLLGRRCHVWPTATPLVADLFASTIAPYFPSAVFHGRLPDAPAQNS